MSNIFNITIMAILTTLAITLLLLYRRCRSSTTVYACPNIPSSQCASSSMDLCLLNCDQQSDKCYQRCNPKDDECIKQCYQYKSKCYMNCLETIKSEPLVVNNCGCA